ncbi:hypothetical protein ACFPRL_03095 [Pseudoclavibacter helvolus]
MLRVRPLPGPQRSSGESPRASRAPSRMPTARGPTPWRESRCSRLAPATSPRSV